MPAVLRAVMESGEAYDDPSEDLLYELLLEVDQGEALFAIVERTADPSGQTYAQVIKDGSGGWTVERREGGPDQHYSTTCPDLRAAHKVLADWMFGPSDDPGSSPTWLRLTV